jgi:hypothetical protein
MPRFKIETSLFEPVTIEVEGGRTYESAPLSPSMLREIDKLEKKKDAGTLDSITAVVQQVAFIFGLEPKDIETVDFRILNRILEHVATVMIASKAEKVVAVVEPKTPKTPEAEVTAEKNAPMPEAEVSQ